MILTDLTSPRSIRPDVICLRSDSVFSLAAATPPALRPLHAHLVGAAGSGMQALGEFLRQANWQTTGSDLARARLGGNANFSIGHAAENIPATTDLVVFSDAMPPDNVELRQAATLGIPTLSYPAALAAVMADRWGIAVAGTHGKSTTAAMLAAILAAADFDPTVVVGARQRGGGPVGSAGCGPWMVAEACEYRANFLHLRPRMAAVLGIEPDHFDCFPTGDALDSAFAAFVEQLPPDGRLLINGDCAASRRAARHASCERETFGRSVDADWQARRCESRAGRYTFEVVHRNRRVCRAGLQVPGRHNVTNALAAAALAAWAGASAAAIQRGLKQFAGLERRLEPLLDTPRLAVVDDFAHLPAEITAALNAVREMYTGRRLWCVFQPHQASRTARLLDEFAASLHNADKVFVADIFRAREGAAKMGEITSADLARRAAAYGADVQPGHDPAEIEVRLTESLQPGDVLLTLGAGDIGNLAHGIVKRV